MDHTTTAAPPTWRAYSQKTAAAILEVPVGQIEAAVRDGKLDHFRVGKHIRISDSALRRFAGQDATAA